MMIFLFGVLNDEQRALVERIFHEHRVHFQRISFKIVKSEEAAEDVVSTAFVKIMDNIEKISELPCPQMTAFCVILILDEPFNALDEKSVLLLRKLLCQCRDEGKLIIVTSHHKDDIEAICDEVIVMQDGTLKKPNDEGKQ